MCAEVIDWNPAAAQKLALGEAVLNIGVFDGVHLGHRALIAAGIEQAQHEGMVSLVLTFDRDPDDVLHPDTSPTKLLSDDERIAVLATLDVDYVVVLPADESTFSLEPEAFLDTLELLCTPRAIHVGFDFRFGSRASGDVAFIERWGQSDRLAVPCECFPHGLIEYDEAPISSTRIRALLAAGEVAEAGILLDGRPHHVRGIVVHGRGEGADMGFATANLDFSAHKVLLPADGVYGGYGVIGDIAYPAAINVGVAPSFEGATALLEAHMLGCREDLYGKQVEVRFLERLRDSRVFESQEELILTVQSDIAWVEKNLGGGPLGDDR